jgi:hypothetical protein
MFNIYTFIILSFTFVTSFIALLIYLILIFILKKEDTFLVKGISIKWGMFITLGIFLVFSLNFFHILNIYWGLLILAIVLIALFII